jgi:hypothetical protein
VNGAMVLHDDQQVILAEYGKVVATHTNTGYLDRKLLIRWAVYASEIRAISKFAST